MVHFQFKTEMDPTTSKDFGFGSDRSDGDSRSSKEDEERKLSEGEEVDGRLGAESSSSTKPSTTNQKPTGQ